MQSRRYICTGLMSLSASRGLRGRPGLVSSGLEAWHGDRRAEAGGAEGSRGAQVSGMEARSQWPGRFTRRKTLSQAAGLFVGPEGEPWEGGRGITVWEGAWWSGGEHSDRGGSLSRSWTGGCDDRPHQGCRFPSAPPSSRRPPPGLTLVAEGQPLLLARLDVGHPQVAVVDEGEEGGVSGADLGVHPGSGTLGLDFQGLHGGHLGTHRDPAQGVRRPPPAPPPPHQRAGLTMKPFLPPSRQ